MHYSCESFIDSSDGHTPRITSIAVRYFNSAQTKSFSIHKVAEQMRINFDKIEENYDICEKQMLFEFFTFAQSHGNYYWIHWNMRDETFGFYAIENRYKVLGGTPTSIFDDKKIDLANTLITRYGDDYIASPRMATLAEKNKMKHEDFLLGLEESTAFVKKEYIRLHKSTLRKVELFTNIIIASEEGRLVTDSKWRDIYGIDVQGIFEACKESWIFYVITSLLGIVIGAVLGRWLG